MNTKPTYLNSAANKPNSACGALSTVGLEEVYVELQPVLLQLGRAFTHDEELIRDCVQDVFLSILSCGDRIASIDNIRSYLSVALRNRIFDRKACNGRYVSLGIDNQTDNESADTCIFRREHQDRIDGSIRRMFTVLSPRQRKVMTLYWIDEREYDDICNIMHLKYQSVRNLMHRSMLKVRSAAV